VVLASFTYEVLAQRVEHIGSTAVPGMAAKEVIDIQVSVDDLVAAATLFDAPRRGLGFVRSPYERIMCRRGTSRAPGRGRSGSGAVVGTRTAT
jgi:dephospho-CoA kinase